MSLEKENARLKQELSESIERVSQLEKLNSVYLNALRDIGEPTFVTELTDTDEEANAALARLALQYQRQAARLVAEVSRQSTQDTHQERKFKCAVNGCENRVEVIGRACDECVRVEDENNRQSAQACQCGHTSKAHFAGDEECVGSRPRCGCMKFVSAATQVPEAVRRGVEQAKRGELKDLGSFALCERCSSWRQADKKLCPGCYEELYSALEQIRDFAWSDERVNVLKHIAREALKSSNERKAND